MGRKTHTRVTIEIAREYVDSHTDAATALVRRECVLSGAGACRKRRPGRVHNLSTTVLPSPPPNIPW